MGKGVKLSHEEGTNNDETRDEKREVRVFTCSKCIVCDKCDETRSSFEDPKFTSGVYEDEGKEEYNDECGCRCLTSSKCTCKKPFYVHKYDYNFGYGKIQS